MKFDAEVNRAIAYWAPLVGVAIDSRLVHAIIQKESSHGAQSVTAESGNRFSYGPMMVLDSTARGYGVADPAALQDPALGIWWGVRYLADQLRHFPGDVAAAVAAYNAGQGNAHRNAAGRFPNQGYVDAVLGWWRIYGGGGIGLAGAVLSLVIGTFLLLRAVRRRRSSR